MARPKQNRIIAESPLISGFRPYGRCCQKREQVQLKFDEYEAIRLIDYEGKMQDDAAKQMNVSRPTLTRIYAEARKKLALALVEGKHISITNDNIAFEHYQSQKSNIQVMNQKIAIPTCEGKLWQHFGKAPQVTFVTVEDGKIKESVVLQAPEHEHGAMPKFIAAQGATDVLCGGLGQGAVNMLNQLGIQVHGGAPAIAVEEVLSQYLGGTIVYGDSSCHHHCDHHHEG
jgi:predicted DNA-binding protein (UPF0251 family)/predicted Fe-Mo cluster-binding NifX family protein